MNQPLIWLEYQHLDHWPAEESALSDSERERAARLLYAEDRARFVAGRHWVRQRLGERLGCRPAAVPLTTTGARGKPVIDHAHPSISTRVPSFNLTHTGPHALLALSLDGVALGVDLEYARAFARAAPIAARHFNAAEAAAVDALTAGPAREAVFFRTWTRKEAYLKLTGLGLPGGLANVETGTEAAARVLSVPPEHGLATAWVTTLALPSDLPSGLVAALAAPTAVTVRWRQPQP